MCLARTGDVVLIEFKTGPRNPDFRHALAQLIDYGSDLWKLTLEGFESVVQCYVRGKHCLPAFATAADLWAAVGLTNWKLSDIELDSLRRRLADVLASGDFAFVVAAQRFTPSMEASLDYLNATMRAGRFFLVEVAALSGRELTVESLSVGWTFLEGAQWYSAKHLTLRVDPASLQGTPSIADAVSEYIANVGDIAGAANTPGMLSAFTFTPAVVPSAREAIIATIERLVQATSGAKGES